MNPETTERHELRITVNAANPIEYLACCGLFEIMARFDETALAHWHTDGITSFVLETAQPETVWRDVLQPTLTDFLGHWKTVTNATQEVIGLRADFTDAAGRIERFNFDWWYESVLPDGGINKSGWKMYAGQQKAEKITADMVQRCRELPLDDVAGILRQASKVSGSFGFDPMASRNALDVGYSSNDLNLPVVTNPYAQLLAMFGVQGFFPPRTQQANTIDASRGWIREQVKDKKARRYYFAYSLWPTPAPIVLARCLANAPAEMSADGLQHFRAPRASRDKYSNLTLASTSSVTSTR